jgi:hypothetical protein
MGVYNFHAGQGHMRCLAGLGRLSRVKARFLGSRFGRIIDLLVRFSALVLARPWRGGLLNRRERL